MGNWGQIAHVFPFSVVFSYISFNNLQVWTMVKEKMITIKICRESWEESEKWIRKSTPSTTNTAEKKKKNIEYHKRGEKSMKRREKEENGWWWESKEWSAQLEVTPSPPLPHSQFYQPIPIIPTNQQKAIIYGVHYTLTTHNPNIFL